MDNELDGLDQLLQAVQELALARTVDDVVEIVRLAAREVTGADGATFVLRDGEQCYYVDENAIEPLWRGMRFPLEACVSGWAMLNKDTAIIPDIYDDPRVPTEAYKPTFVKSMVMVPIRTIDPVGAIGNYWSTTHGAKPTQVRFLRALADATSVALEHVAVREQLNERDNLAHQLAELSTTDELTGVLNRRGFRERAPKLLTQAHEEGMPAVLAYLDLNGLKQINDNLGHAAGDYAIKELAAALREVGGPGAIIGRIGGDEFAAVILGYDPETLRPLLEAAITARHEPGSSIGLAAVSDQDNLTIDELLALADGLMYTDKQRIHAERRTAARR